MRMEGLRSNQMSVKLMLKQCRRHSTSAGRPYPAGGGSKSVLIYIHNSILRTSDNHTKRIFVSVRNWTEHLFILERCILTTQWLHSRPASICQAQSGGLTHETEAFATAVVGQGAGDSPSEMNCAIGRSRQSPTLSGCIESGGV